MPRVDLRISEKLKPLIVTPKRIKIAVGGRGSSKSIGFGDIMIMRADQGHRICAAREFQNSIDDSVHENLKEALLRMQPAGFAVMAKEIRSASGGEIFYKGLARNVTSMKSIGNVDDLWIEEGESVSDNSLKILTPSIRSSASANDGDPPEIWISMNRGSANDAVAKKYLSRAETELQRCGYYEDDLMMVVELNWRDNPWFPPELEQERADDEKNLSTAEYNHIWEGHYYDEVENSIIPVEWFNAAIDAHLHPGKGFKPRGLKIVTHDPSDTGADPRALCERHGSVVLEVKEQEHGDVNDGCDWATDYAIDCNADLFNWDCDGLGVSLRRQVASSLDGKHINYYMFKGSETPDQPEEIYQKVGLEIDQAKRRTNKQTFKNKRAQFYWMLRDRFYATYRSIVKGEYIDPDSMISISSGVSNINKLRTEVCKIPRKPNGNGMIQIMTKKDMKDKYEIPSPNMADCLMMSMFIEQPEEVINLEFDSEW